ncbi:MAG: dihydropteroate synthase [Ilumatobacteraceae bacterium]
MKLFGVLNASRTRSTPTRSSPTPPRRRPGSRRWSNRTCGASTSAVRGRRSRPRRSRSRWSGNALAPVLPELVATGRPVSVDTWRVETARRALEAGATWMNAADGLQQDEMLGVARDFGCPVVLPFLSGPDPSGSST